MSFKSCLCFSGEARWPGQTRLIIWWWATDENDGVQEREQNEDVTGSWPLVCSFNRIQRVFHSSNKQWGERRVRKTLALVLSLRACFMLRFELNSRRAFKTLFTSNDSSKNTDERTSVRASICRAAHKHYGMGNKLSRYSWVCCFDFWAAFRAIVKCG